MKAIVFAVVALMEVPRCISGQARTPARPRDPVFPQIVAREPDFADRRTRRMEVLADIWGNLALYHPAPSTWRLKWDDVLIQALQELPKVRSESEFAALLNRIVFAPLKDHALYATTIAENDNIPILPAALTHRALSGGSTYISATDQGYARQGFARSLSSLIDSLSKTKPIRRLVIDLRSSNPVIYRPPTGGTVAGLWLQRASSRGADVSLLRATDQSDVGGYRVLMSPRDSLKPIAPYQAYPTVFLVNRTSYPIVEQSLDAVRNARTDIAIVFEPGGPIPNLGYNAFQQLYPDSILIPHSRTAAIAVDGALGNAVDLTVDHIDLDSLETLADRALAARAIPVARTPFVVSDSRIRDDTVSTRTLSPEARLAGLLKTRFWVSRFAADLDDSDHDWRRIVSIFAPRVQAAQSDADYYRILVEIAQSLHDTHVAVRHPVIRQTFALGDFSIPASARWLGNRLVITIVDSSGRAAGLQPGDEVIEIDGQPIARLRTRKGKFWTTSLPGDLPPPREYLMGPQNSELRLRVRTKTASRDVMLKRTLHYRTIDLDPQRFPGHPAYTVLPGNLGYVDLVKITSRRMSDSVFEALRNTRGIVLDSRSGLAVDTELEFSRLLTAPSEWTRELESMSLMHSSFSPQIALGSWRQWNVPFQFGKWKYTKPVVIMISNANISSGESPAQLFKLSNRAVLVGNQTNGTYGSRDGIVLPGGARFEFTVGRALFPSGEKYHRIGVQPDVEATPTIAGLRAGRDEVLEVAIKTLKKLISQP